MGNLCTFRNGALHRGKKASLALLFDDTSEEEIEDEVCVDLADKTFGKDM